MLFWRYFRGDHATFAALPPSAEILTIRQNVAKTACRFFGTTCF
jgi:hypothetical protein